MASYSFDVVSKVSMPEVVNAVTQASKEIAQRYDFKGSASSIDLVEEEIKLTSDDDYKLQSVKEILDSKMIKRGVPLKCLVYGEIEPAASGTVRQIVTIQQGIEKEKAKEIVKSVKKEKFKVQVQIQGDQLRVSSKKKDDLQQVITYLKSGDFGVELQFENYR